MAQKSHGKCLSIHLPLLKSGQSSTLHADASNDIETAYEHAYNLEPDERQQIIANENGRQRFPAEGKACLERYRLASTRIFGVVLESLEKLLGRGNFILERASIDELFLDVTEYCIKEQERLYSKDAAERVEFHDDATIVVDNVDVSEVDPSDVQLLRQGCWVAKAIRQSVFETLGFTLSAGISTSKLVAKLGASYGKPNGQAVIYPSAIHHVMNETPIRKVRNLGGKIGKSVVALLPSNLEPTMGNLRDYLSLPQLATALGFESAQRVFDNARGIDNETVKETAGALVKSVTAFKSFFQASMGSPEVMKWIQLLSLDVVSRVQQDMERNHRYPKSCSVQYTFSKKMGAEARSKDRMTKSIRIPFPKEHVKDMQQPLAIRAHEAIFQREGSVFLHRIGLCAMEFETRMTNGGISSFFGSKSNSKIQPGIAVSPVVYRDLDRQCVCAGVCNCNSGDDFLILESKSPAVDPVCERERRACTPSGDVVAYNDCLDCTSEENRKLGSNSCFERSTSTTKAAVVDSDLDVAKKLQATFDRENSLLATLERRRPPSKRRKIDSFFQKSSK